jgi:TPR repeat protein
MRPHCSVCTDEAIDWCRRACDGGLADAFYELAVRYRSGKQGLERDENAAMDLLRAAAANGSVEAHFAIGFHYDTVGPARNLREAVAFYTRAAQAGHAEAQYMLGLC